jgi:hypothetical protein
MTRYHRRGLCYLGKFFDDDEISALYLIVMRLSLTISHLHYVKSSSLCNLPLSEILSL